MRDPEVLVPGFAFSGFRSVHTKEMVVISPLTKVTLLAGRNNSGKSNTLRFAERYLIPTKQQVAPTDLDIPRPQSVFTDFTYSIAVHEEHPLITEAIKTASRTGPGIADSLKKILSSPPCRTTEDELIWIEFAPSKDGSGRIGVADKQCWSLRKIHDEKMLQSVSTALTSINSDPVEDARRVLSFVDIARSLPPLASIDAFRQIGQESRSIHNGRGLIESLQQLQNPLAINSGDRAKFAAINKFVQWVFDDPETSIEVAFNNSTINLVRTDSMLPLEHYGTGIHQVIIIAAAATVLENHLVCIEEPEVNLHPILQRKMLEYLRTKTNNQYLIATHSAQMLDYEKCSVFSVRNGQEGTEIVAAKEADGVSQICADLGYRPSDLLQTNAVVWVEGPSDRIYLRHWIDVYSKGELIEGIDYSIMFYGGKILSSLSVDDPSYADEFISLRRLNRNIAVVIDSDMRHPTASINSTKERIVQRLNAGNEPSLAWVTDGYTIENYIPDTLLRFACAQVHPKDSIVGSDSRWTNPLLFPEKPRKDANKVKIARKVCENWDRSTWPEDLVVHVAKLCAMLNQAVMRERLPISSAEGEV